jgi:16S rRNA (uracil1498-N3)-methyltransferase
MSADLTGLARRAAASAQVFVANLEAPVLTADDDHHLARVLRLRAGEAVVAADGSGRWRMCDYVGLGESLIPVSEVFVDDVSSSSIAVAFAPVKGDRPEWAFAKLVEQGVDIICLLMTDHSVVKWGDERAERHRLRLDKIAVAAAAQSRRVTLPRLIGPMTLAEAAAALPGLHLADIGGAAPTTDLAAIAIGPEGGWSAAERALGLPTVGLGNTVLRAETATLAAGSLVQMLRSGTVQAGR